MKDKEKQIEEMAKHGCYDGCASGLRKFCDEYDGKPCKNMVRIASGLYEQGYRKIDKDSVVLSREEINNADYFYVKDGELIPVEKGRGKFITIEWYTELLMKMPLGHELAKERKETAEKILRKGHEYLMNSTDKAIAFACFLGAMEHDYGIKIKE